MAATLIRNVGFLQAGLCSRSVPSNLAQILEFGLTDECVTKVACVWPNGIVWLAKDFEAILSSGDRRLFISESSLENC